jgi:hypothetical protein
MNNKIKIDNEVKNVMQMIIREHPTALVAGGYLRDLYCGAIPTDVDIFIQENNSVLNISRIDKLFDLNHNSGDSIRLLQPKNPKGSCAGRNHIVNVYDIYKDGINFQAIILNKSPQEYVNNHFDTGINMCYYDGNLVRFTPEFMSDFNNKTVTIRGVQTPIELYLSVTRHVPKILQKYPTFDVRVDVESVQGFKQVF